MSLLSAILLGFVQGVAEFLPISSSGHLSILQNLFGVTTAENGHMLFDVMLHLGTLISVFIFYWNDIKAMFEEVFSLFRAGGFKKAISEKPTPTRRFVVMFIIALLPHFLILPVKDAVEELYYNTFFIGATLILTGCLLFVSDKLIPGKKNEKNMTIANALLIGFSQCIATIPGLSRSGTTITAGLVCGLDREFAVKFSFLISLPAIFAANLLTLFEALGEGIDASLIPVYLAGMVVAGVVGYFCLGLVKKLSQNGKFGKFSYYCWVVGAVTIILSAIF